MAERNTSRPFFSLMRIDAIAECHFYPTADGGLAEAFTSKTLKCPLQIGDKFFESVLVCNDKEIGPGRALTCSVILLCPEAARAKVVVGGKFLIKSGFSRDCGVGTFIEIIPLNRLLN